MSLDDLKDEDPTSVFGLVTTILNVSIHSHEGQIIEFWKNFEGAFPKLVSKIYESIKNDVKPSFAKYYNKYLAKN